MPDNPTKPESGIALATARAPDAWAGGLAGHVSTCAAQLAVSVAVLGGYLWLAVRPAQSRDGGSDAALGAEMVAIQLGDAEGQVQGTGRG